MSRPDFEYEFPEKRGRYALELTEPQFNIMESKGRYDKLFVDFSQVRSLSLFNEMKFALGISNEELMPSRNYQKFIFSGHRGCGKSVELERFAKAVHHPNKFFSLYIDLEQEIHLSRLQPEDLIIIVISVLLRHLERENVHIHEEGRKAFEKIAEDWLGEEEVARELSESYDWEAEASIKAGWSFWEFFGLEGKLRGVYAQENQVTHTIRKKVKSNQRLLIANFNQALNDVRDALEYKNKGRDILIILDGFEKANSKVYETLFVEDTAMMEEMGVHFICCVPIKTYYDILDRPSLELFKTTYLPMIRQSEVSIPLLKELITKRVHPDLIAEDILEKFISYSGGCPRQLLKIVNLAILKSLGEPITPQIMDDTLMQMGGERYIALTMEHKKILSQGKFDNANREVLELLFSLNLLEYNGLRRERKINPLIEHYFVG